MCVVVHSRTNPGEHSAIWTAGRAKRCRLYSTQRPHCRRNKIPSCGWVIPCKVFGPFCSLASLLLSLVEVVSYYFTEPSMEGRDICCCMSLIRCDSLFFVLLYFFGCVFKVCVNGECAKFVNPELKNSEPCNIPFFFFLDCTITVGVWLGRIQKWILWTKSG